MNFFCGVATAAFQIEGAVEEDGRGMSIWDTMCRRPGAIFTGENADTACDHYHRYREDIQWMKKLGVNAYRFSIAWPRIMPDGKNLNPEGIDFYKRLCDALLENGIEPFATLYHWDMPQALEDQGGWMNRDTVRAFQLYAETIVKALQGRVKNWMTFNEPWGSAVFGYQQGIHAPGRKESYKAVAGVIHHLLLAHGRAVQAVRKVGAPDSQVGIVLNPYCAYPATDSKPDVEAFEKLWRLENGWWLDPLYFGRYPEGSWRGLYEAVPDIKPGDMEIISEPTDFLGLNIYSSWEISNDWMGFQGFRSDPPKDRLTAAGMALTPETIYDTIVKIRDNWPVENFIIAENGAPGKNEILNDDGSVHDGERVECLKGNLLQVERLITEGIGLKGYFVWTLMDNFEWIWGYSVRYGLLYVDFENGLKRIPKDGFHFYQQWIVEHHALLDELGDCQS